jgi:hypothetical protein
VAYFCFNATGQRRALATTEQMLEDDSSRRPDVLDTVQPSGHRRPQKGVGSRWRAQYSPVEKHNRTALASLRFAEPDDFTISDRAERVESMADCEEWKKMVRAFLSRVRRSQV